MKTFYGLDFGTSNTVVTLFRDGKVSVLPVGIDGKKHVPSIIYLNNMRDGGKYWVGDTAITQYLKDIDDSMAGSARLLQSIKMFLPEKEAIEVYVPGHKVCELFELIALIITHVKKQADKLCGADIKSVVMGKPGRFSANPELEQLAEDRLRMAAELAGFEEIHFVREPIAAAFYYETMLTAPQKALIADFGGGTSDFTIAQLSPQALGKKDRSTDILGTNGISFAGDAFDSAIVWEKLGQYFGRDVQYQKYAGSPDRLTVPAHIVQHITDWKDIGKLRTPRNREFLSQLKVLADDPDAFVRLLHLADSNQGFNFFRAVERAKCGLAEAGQGELVFSHGPIDISQPLTELEFDKIAADGLGKIGRCLGELLEQVGLVEGDIDSVFMTGGTSQLPCIQNLFAELFGREKLKSSDALLSVAAGLAVSAKTFLE